MAGRARETCDVHQLLDNATITAGTYAAPFIITPRILPLNTMVFRQRAADTQSAIHSYHQVTPAGVHPGDHLYDVRKPNDMEVITALAQIMMWPVDPDVIWEEREHNIPPSACIHMAERSAAFRERFSLKAAKDLRAFL